jgi:hypothetical protein
VPFWSPGFRRFDQDPRRQRSALGSLELVSISGGEFTEITTNQGFVDKRVDIVYATVPLNPDVSRRRPSRAEQAASRYAQILRTLAGGKRRDLSKEEARVLELWGKDVDNATLRAASQRVRIQRGQADKFREGLIRSGAWEQYIEKALDEAGVPPEIVALPHVESSFNPMARSTSALPVFGSSWRRRGAATCGSTTSSMSGSTRIARATPRRC